MLLQLNKDFQGYTPTKKISKSTTYRDIYRAISDNGQEIALIVYDMNNLPKCYEDEIVPELELIPVLTDAAFPKFINRGFLRNSNTHLRWVATEFIHGKTLTECIADGRSFSDIQSLENFQKILGAVNEISRRLLKGGHNNINTDNIIISTDNSGDEQWYLMGLNCMSEPCRGKLTFDRKFRQFKFCAPELAIGVCKQNSDIFSLGIVLSYLLQRRHPWEKVFNASKTKSLLTIAKYYTMTRPAIELEKPLYDIVNKAIQVKQSHRYKTLNEFSKDISRFLGKDEILAAENPKKSTFETKSIFPDFDEEEKDEDFLYEDDNIDVCSVKPESKTQSISKENISFEKKKGNGFKDVAGMKELKDNLTRNFVNIMRNPQLAKEFSISPPNGLLLYGPPGVGKTYIANKLAEESGLLFRLIKPSDLGSIYIHGSQNMIAELFKKSEDIARKNKRGILLVFDEFDSFVPKRNSGSENSNQANEVAEFLTRLNNCAEKGIYVVATTNRIDSIDTSITRKGRLDLIIYVGLPDEDARREMFELELSKRPYENIDLGHIAKLTEGYTSSDISYIVKESARVAFEKSIHCNKVIKITQELIESTISSTRSSVTTEEMRVYEQMRDKYSNITKSSKDVRNRIGFIK